MPELGKPYTVSHHIVSHHIVSHCTAPHCTAPRCTVPHYIAPHCTVPHCTASHCLAALTALCPTEYVSPPPKVPTSAVQASRLDGLNRGPEGGGSPTKKMKSIEVRMPLASRVHRLTMVHRGRKTKTWTRTTLSPLSPKCLRKSKPNCSTMTQMMINSGPTDSHTKTLAHTTDHTRTHSLQLRNLRIKLSLVTRTMNCV